VPAIEPDGYTLLLGATSTPAGLAVHGKSEMAKWGPIIKAANIKAE
jgi:hypothetical protein